MAWLRVESNFPHHPKLHSAATILGGPGRGRVIALWILGASYSVAHLTDGFVPFGVMEDPRFDRKPQDVIAAMVTVKLLESVQGGYRLHDFHHYNPSAEAVLAKRKADLERKNRSGIAAESPQNPKRVPADSNALAGATGAHDPNPSPNPSPNPRSLPKEPKPEKPLSRKARSGEVYSSAFLRFWATFPRKTKKPDAWQAWQSEHAEDHLAEIDAALTWQCTQPQWVKDGGQFVPYPASWLRAHGWEDEPFHVEPGAVQGRGTETVTAVQRAVLRRQAEREGQS